MAFTEQSASWSAIATAVIDQLVAVTEIDPAYVRLVASDRYDIDSGEPRSLRVRYFGLSPDTDAGAGRRARPVYRRLRVYTYTRNQLDAYSRDEIALLDADDGQEQLLLQVLDALDEFQPVDESGVALTIEPLHPLPSEGGPPERKATDDLGTLQGFVDFQVRFLARVADPQP